MATSGDTVWESINHHAFLQVEIKAVTLNDDRRRNNIWLPLFNCLSQIQCRAYFSGFLQSFMFQIHTFQSKCFSCHNDFINLFSDVLFNHIIFKKLDGSGQCLNLFCSHLALEELGYLFLYAKKLKHLENNVTIPLYPQAKKMFLKNLFACGLIIKFLKPRRKCPGIVLWYVKYRDC